MSSYGNHVLPADGHDCGSLGDFDSILYDAQVEALHPMPFDPMFRSHRFDYGDYIGDLEEQDRDYIATLSDDHADDVSHRSIVGDFYYYCESDDVTRGVTINAASDFGSSPDDIASPDADYWETKCAALNSATVVTESFDESDCPPAATTDPLFKFQASTLFLASTSPHRIGNQLLNFLDAQVRSTVSKFRRNKFAITADISVYGIGECTLKVRVYKQANHQFAVEFQRRKGDSVAFGQVYREVSQFMCSFFETIA